MVMLDQCGYQWCSHHHHRSLRVVTENKRHVQNLRRRHPRRSLQLLPSWSLIRIAWLASLLLSSAVLVSAKNESFHPIADNRSQAELFEPCKKILVNGPSHFPTPTALVGANATVIVQPTFGKHRPDQDAIFAYSEGYKLVSYMMFLETLRETGYRGDVVLAIAEDRIVLKHVVDYLKTFAVGDEDKPQVIVYQQPLHCSGSANNERRLSNNGLTDMYQFCQLHHVYGWTDEVANVTHAAKDPREGRVVATIRYEWYWIWSQRYNPHSWLMLLDARDTYFQSDPFVGLPRDGDRNSPDGLLYFYGENAQVTRLGQSKKNAQWLTKGYGKRIFNAMADKPTICSGSTLGEQIAIDTYLRALVNEHAENNVRLTGSDQAFHNYLYYSNKLGNAHKIRRIVVWEQGRGIINNLAAFRTKPLVEWGLYDPETHSVYQWDGVTKSPVVHQWDRDQHLYRWMTREKYKAWEKAWTTKKKK